MLRCTRYKLVKKLREFKHIRRDIARDLCEIAEYKPLGRGVTLTARFTEWKLLSHLKTVNEYITDLEWKLYQ